MEKQILEMHGKGLTPYQIAKSLGHKTSKRVKRILREQDQTPNHREPLWTIAEKREQIIELHNQGLSPWRICNKLELGNNQKRVKEVLSEAGLQQNRERKIKRQKENGYGCVVCGDLDKTNFYEGRKKYICKICYRLEQRSMVRAWKQELVTMKGGECEQCGFNQCLSALSFHHLDSKLKDPNWVKLRRRKPEFVKAEIQKCELLCLNCHAAIHEKETI
jgi:hypothetical protein